MKQLIITAFVVFSCCVTEMSGAVLYNKTEHRIWSQCSNGHCSCGVGLENSVLCYNIDGVDSLLIQRCHSLYYDNKQNVTVAGYSLYSCFYHGKYFYSSFYNITRYPVQNQSQFNSVDNVSPSMAIRCILTIQPASSVMVAITSSAGCSTLL